MKENFGAEKSLKSYFGSKSKIFDYKYFVCTPLHDFKCVEVEKKSKNYFQQPLQITNYNLFGVTASKKCPL